MLKNPYINALLAVLYIVIIISIIQWLSATLHNTPDTMLIPITMLCLFVLSAALMGLLFVYTPAKMFFDNQREQALAFFGKIVGTFAVFVVIFAGLLLWVQLSV